MADFSRAYCANEPSTHAFFRSLPKDILSDKPTVARWDSGITQVIGDQQKSLGRLCSLQGDEVLVATGQQPHFCLGPMYTVYKAITALQLARALQESHHIRSCALFWIGEDDHDWEEVKTAHFWDPHYRLIDFTCPREDSGHVPLYGVRLGAEIRDVLRQIAEAVLPALYVKEGIAILEASREASEVFSEWGARLLSTLFCNTDLLIFRPRTSAAHPAVTAVYEREIEEPTATTELLQTRATALRQAGFVPALRKKNEEMHFFLVENNRRHKVLWREGVFHVPTLGMRFSPEEMRHRLHTNPEGFSPNVVLRCVIQQALFPVHVYVGGPGEIAYWAQLAPVFARHGVTFPHVFPRMRALLVPVKAQKILKKYGFSLADLTGIRKEIEKAFLTRLSREGHGVPTGLMHALQRLETALEDIRGAAESCDTETASLLLNFTDQLRQQKMVLERKLAARDQGIRSKVTEDAAALQNMLYPAASPQERILSTFQFVFLEGLDFADRLAAQLDMHCFEEQIVFL